MAFEVNFDGLVGPTHHYAGLSFGNVASLEHKAKESNPREAALQGLAKMKRLSDLGLKQGVLPPQARPEIGLLRRLGFEGNDEEVLTAASREAPELLSSAYSASSMWTANAATVCPSADSEDGKVHFTPANLVNKLHRSLESRTTSAVLRKIFSDARHFSHHEALPPSAQMGDEGAANHTRFCSEYGGAGLQLFVYGTSGFQGGAREPKIFPARHTLEASRAVARLHRLSDDRVVYARQAAAAIDAGVFHNDVVGVGNRDFYFCHEQAYDDLPALKRELSEKFRRVAGSELKIFVVPAAEVSLADAVKSYLFNSQLVSLSSNGGGMALILPEECRANPSVARFLEKFLTDSSHPVREAYYFDLKQSMRNGGGPACLRLRVVLTEEQLWAMGARVLLTDDLYEDLVAWVKKHYRDRLSQADLGDPGFARESEAALRELTGILALGSIYPFQSA